jgi:uncharacterized membrane protein YphA (DoxX/SURF4 family)
MTTFYVSVSLFFIGIVFFTVDFFKNRQQKPTSKINFSKQKVFDFLIIVLRYYLAYYMITYGLGKILGGQFGHRSAEILNTPLKDVDKFNLAWQLFSLDRTFDVVVGISQIIGAILIMINRTALVGAFMLLPILGQIFLVDLAFTTSMLGHSLTIRLAGMIFADMLILFYYKERMVLIWNNLTNGMNTKFKYKWWVFLMLPLLGMISDFVIALLSFPIKYLIYFIQK